MGVGDVRKLDRDLHVGRVVLPDEGLILLELHFGYNMAFSPQGIATSFFLSFFLGLSALFSSVKYT
jgi:hypothetical protein